MKLQAIDHKIMTDDKYTYSYYKKMYDSEIIGAEKKKMKQKKLRPFVTELVLKEDAYIYIKFLYELGLQDFEKNNLEDIAPFLDSQVIYTDDPLHEIVFSMWKKILTISEEDGPSYDLLKAEIYEPVDPVSFGTYS